MPGKKTRRGMNVLIRVLKKKRELKKTSHKTYKRPEGAPVIVEHKAVV